jgi:flagellar export protein FliJ
VKRFRFTLDKLKAYREQLLEREKNALAVMRLERVRFEDEKKAAETELAESSEDFKRKTAAGVSVSEFLTHKNHHYALGGKIAEKQRAIEDAEKRIERQLKKVVEATADVRTLEKLEEKQLEEYTAKAAKEDELFIAEFVNTSQFHKAGRESD